MKYICLGYYDKAKFDAMPETERNAMFDACFEYDEHLRANGHWGGGEALQGSETALTLSWKNGKVATTDGPYAETKEQLGGILIFEDRATQRTECKPYPFASTLEVRCVCGNLIHPILGAWCTLCGLKVVEVRHQ